MNVLLGFSAFIIMLIIYLIIARRAGKMTHNTPDTFFLSINSHDEDQFASSQIAYSLQMATIFPFFWFAFSGEWWIALWNTIFFAFGIGLLYAIAPRLSQNHLKLIGSSATLHSFISKLHNAPSLRIITAWMSIVAFTGLAAFEIVWGARILKILFQGNDSIYYFTICILAFYLVLFLSLGGQRGALNTDQYQLVMAYIGFHLAVIWAIYQPSVSIANMDAPIIIPIIILISLIMLYFRLKGAKEGSLSNKTFNIIIILSLVGMILSLLLKPGLFKLTTLNMNFSNIDMNNEEFIWKITAFAVLPLFFQFVDMTNWQRISSLSSNGASDINVRLRKGLLKYLIESPLSWMLPVILGLCAVQFLTVAELENPWDVFLTKALFQPGLLGSLFTVFVVWAITSVFMSTADGLLSASGYAFAYDISKKSRSKVDANHNGAEDQDQNWNTEDVSTVIGQGRFAFIVFLFIVISFFLIADIWGQQGQTVIGLFLSFFAPLVTLAPAIIIPAISNRVAPANVVLIGIVTGSVAGVLLGIISVFKGGVFQWISIVVPFGISWVIYIFGVLINPRKIDEVNETNIGV